VKEVLVVIAPEEAAWIGFKTSASMLRLEVDLVSSIEAFTTRDLSATNTVVIVDADEHKGRIAGFISALVRSDLAGVITISQQLTRRNGWP
jgi:hypothetical protein